MRWPEGFINKIICGNHLVILRDIPNNSIDLTVTSPPYDKLRDYKGYIFDFKNLAKELYRITKQSGVVVWVVGDATIKGSETGTSFRQALYFKKIGFNLHDTMIYGKNNIRPLTHNRYEQEFEYMFIFGKGKIKSFNPLKKDCIKKPIKDSFRVRGVNSKKDEKRNIQRKSRRIIGNVWQYNAGMNLSTKDNIAFKHPAIFPEKLAEDHIISWSNKGDIVLDPMCGSGTTCKMAKILGRKYIGIDNISEYCEIARRRVDATPEPLF